MNEMQVALEGYVASNPKLAKTKAGRFVANMRVGVTPRRQDKETGQWSDGDTSYMTVTCWRALARNVAVCLRKGDPVVVKGRMRVREYEDKEGRTRTEVEVDASTVGHDLTRGVAHFFRTKRSAGDAPAGAGEGPEAGWPGERADEQEPDGTSDGDFADADMFDDAGIEASSLQLGTPGTLGGGEGNGTAHASDGGPDAGTGPDDGNGGDAGNEPDTGAGPDARPAQDPADSPLAEQAA